MNDANTERIYVSSTYNKAANQYFWKKFESFSNISFFQFFPFHLTVY